MNSLLIEKQTGGYFKFTLNEDTANAITSIQNDLLAVGNQLHFKTGNGANIIKEQFIYPEDVTIIAGGTFTFTTVAQVWNKLIEIDYFAWLGGGGDGVNRFDELLDTFQYNGNAGKAVIVDNSETQLIPTVLYNKRLFTQLEDTPSDLVPDKMVVVNPAGTALILQDQPEPPEQYLNSVGYFDYEDFTTSVVPLSATNGVAKKLTNDTEGVNTSTDQNPYGVSFVWDFINNQFNFSELTIGDTIDVRIHIAVTTTTSNQKVEIKSRFGIGSASQFETVIYDNVFKSSGVHEISFVAPFYLGSLDIINSPAELYLTTDANATIRVYGWYVRILRKNINIITVDYEVPDATTLIKGIVRLGGDLSGTANNPTVPELVNKVPKSTNINTSSPLFGGGNLNGDLTLGIQQANSVVPGFLTAADWSRFNLAHNEMIVSAAVTGTTTKTLSLNQHDGGTITATWDDNDTAITLGTPNGLSLASQVLSLGLSSGSANGALSSTDWTTFNNKQNYLSGSGIVKSTSGVISYLTDNSDNWNTAYNDKINSASVTGTTTKTLTLTQQDGSTITADWTDNNDDSVTSVFGRTGDVIAVNGDYTTSLVTEGSNLYYTEARVSANADVSANTAKRHDAATIGTANGLSLSGQEFSLGLSSGSTTGALSSTDWTTFNNKVPSSRTITINGESYDLSANRSWTIDGGVTSVFGRTGDVIAVSGDYTTSLVTEGSNLYFTNARSRSAISLTTTGTSGSATYDSATGVLNIPNYEGGITLGTPNGLSLSGQELSLGLSSGSANGALSSTDWTTFNSKQPALNGTGFVKISGTTISYDNNIYALDSVVVKLTGNQTIAGEKTFSNALAGTSAIFSSTVQASAFRLTGMTAGSGALYWSSDKVTLANYNTNGIVDIEALGGSSIATFGAFIDLKRTVFVNSNLYAIGLVSEGTPANTLSYLSGSGAIFIKNSSNQTAYAFQMNTSSGLDLWSTNSEGTSTRRMTLDSSGNVGIGTDFPGTKLDVRGNINIGNASDTVTNSFAIQSNKAIFSIAANGGTNAAGTTITYTWGAGGQGPLIFNRSLGVETMRLGADGNVGIGTTSPASRLNVSGDNITVSAGFGLAWSGDTSRIMTPEDNVSGALIQTPGIIRFNAGSSEKMRITSSGNVGIGTAIPLAKLQIVTDAVGSRQNMSNISRTTGNWVRFTNPQYSVDSSMGLLLRVFPDSDSRQGAGIIASGGTNNGDTDLDLFVSTGSTSSTSYSALKIKSDGNVGIGTPSPLNKLHVDNGGIRLSDATNANFRGITFGANSTDSTEYAYIKYTPSTGEMRHWANPSGFGGFTSFYSNATEAMRITSGGNVGIGTSNADARLRVSGTYNGTQAIFANVDGRGLEIATSLTAGTNEAGSVLNARGAGSGTMIFQNDGTERMRITSGGNVLLGTTDTGFNARQLIRFEASGASTRGLAIWNGGGDGSVYVAFANSGGGFTGTITQNSTGVSYNTTSDYRLKEDLKSIKGLELISKIKVYDFKWKNENSRMDGVIAHELQEVVPYAVSGEKDAKEFQQVDYSKLVPILVQAIQELKAEIEILKNK